MLHGSHFFPVLWSHHLLHGLKGHFLPGPRCLTGRALRPLGEKAGRAEIHGAHWREGTWGVQPGRHRWLGTKGRLQAAMERPVGKQLGILPCWDSPRKPSSCGKGSSPGFLDASPCLSLCRLLHIPEWGGHSHPAQVLTYKFKPPLLDSAETTKSHLCGCRLLGEAAGMGRGTHWTLMSQFEN